MLESKTIMFSDKERLFKERTGEEFITLYQKFYPKLIYFINSICVDPQKSEDISTDSFLMALDKIHLYDMSKSQFSTWLFTIGRNLALQDLKNSKKSVSMDVEYDEEGTTMKDFINSTDGEDNSESEHAVTEMKANIMKKYMSELKEPYRTVIEMREIEKMAYQDIANRLNKNLSTIKSQIRNGRIILMTQSQKEFGLIDEMYN